jgi:hypothetical protein
LETDDVALGGEVGEGAVDKAAARNTTRAGRVVGETIHVERANARDKRGRRSKRDKGRGGDRRATRRMKRQGGVSNKPPADVSELI